MSDNKRYYWLKLHRDFFKRHDIQVIEAMENGKDYVLFYLKLLVESVDHEGNLRFSETIPYNEQMLATITRTNIDVVRSALKIFEELELVSILDDQTLYMEKVNEMIGKSSQDEHTKEATRLRVQKYRENQKLLESDALHSCYSNVTCNVEIEKEIEKEIDIREKIDYQAIVELYNSSCPSFPKLISLSDARKKAIKARLKTYSMDNFETLFRKAEASDFLKGKNDRNWSANFDWLIKDSNMAKVMDGNYDNKNGSKNSFNQFVKNDYDFAKLEELLSQYKIIERR